MKIKLDSNKLFNSAITRVLKVRGFLIVVVVVGLLGYGGYIVSRIVALQPDPAYLATQRQALGSTKINFDKSTIDTINNLVQINTKTDLTNIGKTDPFSP